MTTRATDCIFCRIIAGEIPCVRIYEDDTTLAFLDIAPVTRGHTLVVPRQHSESLVDTPPATLARLMAAAGKVARAQFDGLGADGVNLTQANGAAAGQVVPHIHFHLIPRFADDGLPPIWTSGSYRNDDERAAVAAALRTGLDGMAGTRAGA